MNITERVKHIQHLLRQVEISCHRHQDEVILLAASKGHSSAEIKEAFAAGLHHFGENYLQEGLQKIQELSALPVCWHYIGPLQSNKTKSIAGKFSWVHSVSRQKIAQQLNDARPINMPPLNICIQVNLDDEEAKSGVDPNGVGELASYILQLPRLHLRGLMLIPKQQTDDEKQYLSFLRLTHLLASLNQQLNITMDTLSMGMSNDFQSAIRAGSTIVRVGTAIFGERQPKGNHEN